MAMDINGLLSKNLKKAWSILTPRLKTCQYRAIKSSPYDPVTATSSSTVTTTTVKAFIFDNDLSLVGDGSDIQVSDKRSIILSDNLPEIAGREKAEPGDKILDHKGHEWTVLLVRGEPDFYFDLTLRR